jgi:ribosome-associated protein
MAAAGAIPAENGQAAQRAAGATATDTSGPGGASRGGGALAGSALLGRVLASLEDDKAEEVVTIGLKGRSEMADHMVIASGRSSRQVAAIADKLLERLKHDAGIVARIEGKETGDWVLIDAGDVIVHVFRPEVREFYQLEKLWQPSGLRATP